MIYPSGEKPKGDSVEDQEVQVIDDPISFDKIQGVSNVAELLSKDQLRAVGKLAVEEYEADEASRSEWLEMSQQAIELAMMIKKKKTYPWVNAANIKYPLVAMAATQFASRSYKLLIRKPQLLKCLVLGKPTPQMIDDAYLITKYMSWDLLENQETWDEDMDHLLHVLPVLGCVFKKVYYDPETKKNISDIIFPQDLVVDYMTKHMSTCPRVSHKLIITARDVESKVRRKTFIPFDSTLTESDINAVETSTVSEATVETTGDVSNTTTDPNIFIEQHRFLDLDQDGYSEPYVVTVHYSSQQVVRITKRFKKDGIERDGKKILEIKADNYFLKYEFIKSFDGSFYSIGYGRLLGSLNKGIETIFNMILDSGHLNNLQSGFFAKGIKFRAGSYQFRPNQWEGLETSGLDLQKNLFPLPVKPPSQVMLALMGLVVEAGEKAGSITDTMQGQSPGADVAAKTVDHLVAEGSKVLGGVLGRCHRGIKTEFQAMFNLNCDNLNGKKSFTFGDEGVSIDTGLFERNKFLIVPYNKAAITSPEEAIARAKEVLGMVEISPNVSRQFATKALLEAFEVENINEMFIPDEEIPPPPPDPKLIIETAKLEHSAKQLELARLETVYKILKTKADTLRATASAIQLLSTSNLEVPEQQLGEAIEMLGIVRDGMMQDTQLLLGESHGAGGQEEEIAGGVGPDQPGDVQGMEGAPSLGGIPGGGGQTV